MNILLVMLLQFGGGLPGVPGSSEHQRVELQLDLPTDQSFGQRPWMIPDLGFDGPRRVICMEAANRKYEQCLDRIQNIPSPDYNIEEALCLAALDIRTTLCNTPECNGVYPCDDHIDLCSVL